MTATPPPPPEGRDAVRAAIIEVAGRHFASFGTRASLRDIAKEARVNLGLIHRHIGNKDDLLQAVLETRHDVGLAITASTQDSGEAMRQIFTATAESGVSVRTLAWMLLSGQERERFPTDFPAIRALQSRAGGDEGEFGLLAAFAMTYGWTVFGEQLIAAFGYDPSRRAELAERLARLAGELAQPPTG